MRLQDVGGPWAEGPVDSVRHGWQPALRNPRLDELKHGRKRRDGEPKQTVSKGKGVQLIRGKSLTTKMGRFTKRLPVAAVMTPWRCEAHSTARTTAPRLNRSCVVTKKVKSSVTTSTTMPTIVLASWGSASTRNKRLGRASPTKYQEAPG
jgi:hypothetical protein